MDWNRLMEFVQGADSSVAAALVGVPPSAVQRAEATAGVRLPESYRGFLTRMGRDSGGLHLFGPGYSQSFDDLAAELPAETYPGTSYFKIAVSIDESDISAPDYFLDLARSDGEDAPVVMFEDVGEFSHDVINDTGFTFGEQVTRRLFTMLVLDRAPEQATMVVGHLSREQRTSSHAAALALLQAMELVTVLPELPRVSCLHRDRLGAMVQAQAGGLSLVITVCHDERMSLEVALDQLRERFPAAAVRRRSAGTFDAE
jgi:hypothetical protein